MVDEGSNDRNKKDRRFHAICNRTFLIYSLGALGLMGIITSRAVYDDHVVGAERLNLLGRLFYDEKIIDVDRNGVSFDDYRVFFEKMGYDTSSPIDSWDFNPFDNYWLMNMNNNDLGKMVQIYGAERTD